MAHPRLPFIDSFDHWATAQGTRKWTAGAGTIVAGGRHGNGCQITATASCATWFSEDVKNMAAGVAYKTQGYGGTIIAFRTPWESSVVTSILELRHLGDGRLYLASRLASGQEINHAGASGFVMQLNQWYYVELLAQISGSTGSYQLDYKMRINEEVIFDGFSWQIPWAMGQMNGVMFQGPGGGYNATIDDVYVTEGALLGEIRIGVIRPNGAGVHSAWTPSAAVDHYTLVDDATPDDNTTYLTAPSSGLEEDHAYEDISVSGEIKAVQTLACLKKSDAGTATTKSLLINGAGSEELGETFYPSETSYLYDRIGYLVSPFTGVAFTEAEVNALQFGVKRVT